MTLRHEHDARIAAIAIPALGALAADPLVSMVDTAFVGQLGTIELAALGVNASVFTLAFVVFNFLAYGTTPLIADALGRDARDEAARVAIQGAWLALWIGLAAAATLLLLAEPILWAMGVDAEAWAPALTYLRIRALAAPAVLWVTWGHGVYRGLGDTRTALWVTLALNAVNLVLDPVLMFGLGWGMAGAAWATVVAQWAGALWFLALLGQQPQGLPLRYRWVAPTRLLGLLKVGGVLSLRTLSLIGALTVATSVAARMGLSEVGAHQVLNQLWGFLALVVDALAVAGQTLLAQEIGAGRGRVARSIGNRLLVLGAVLGVVLAALMAAAGPWLVPWFSPDPEVQALVYGVMPIVVVMQPVNGVLFVLDGLFMGARRFRYLAVAMAGASALALGLFLAVHVLQLSLLTLWGAIAVFMVVRVASLLIPWGRGGVLNAERPPWSGPGPGR